MTDFVELCPICEAQGRKVGVIRRRNSAVEAVHHQCLKCGTRWVPRREAEQRLPLEIELRMEPSNTLDWVTGYLSPDFMRRPSVRVLDVGCWAGGFIKGLPSSWKKHGVEINAGAAARAQRVGIDVWVGEIQKYPGIGDRKFDAIFMLDILEHISSPLSVLKKMNSLLDDSGFLFVLTGNAACTAARIFGARWYYMNYPEHVVCPSAEGLAELFNRSGFALERIKPVRHYTSGWGEVGGKIKGRLLGGDRLDEKLALSRPQSFFDSVGLNLSRLLKGSDHIMAIARKA